MTEDKNITKGEKEKINSLKSIIEEAEKSLYSARSMLARLENKESKSAPQKRTFGASPDGRIVEGVFDGQLMIGNDGKQYPVPANYASKSRLVEGDLLKLTITDDGNFVYKQIGPVDRKRLIGIVDQDESGNYMISADGKRYKVLLASVTYYKAQPGDEVTIVLPRTGDPIWCSIENVTKKAFEMSQAHASDNFDMDDVGVQDPFMKKERQSDRDNEDLSLDLDISEDDNRGIQVNDEWTPKLSLIEKEAREIEESTKKMEEDLKNTKNSGKQQIVKADFPDTPEEVLLGNSSK